MGEFHEHCAVILNQIRAIRPFVTFVFQNCPVANLVGDARSPREVCEAIHEGFEVGMEI